jgi:hypothetical protein
MPRRGDAGVAGSTSRSSNEGSGQKSRNYEYELTAQYTRGQRGWHHSDNESVYAREKIKNSLFFVTPIEYSEDKVVLPETEKMVQKEFMRQRGSSTEKRNKPRRLTHDRRHATW